MAANERLGAPEPATPILPAPQGETAWANAGALFLAFAGALLAFRILALTQLPLGLHPDEAQYWVWSRSLEWGYFSKPPLVAWAIAATTAVFGDDAWAVRLSAPVAHALGAGALFLLARRAAGGRAGWFAGLGWLMMPGVWLSSSIVSTDALMLPIWSVGLYCAWRWIECGPTGRGRTAFAAATGAAIGAGALAKYAMLYFPLGLALACAVSPAARRAVLSRAGLLAAAVAGAVLAPNLVWNATHDFQTVSHTAANADLAEGIRFNPEEIGAFFADQVGVAGLLTLLFAATMIGALLRRGRVSEPAPAAARKEAERFLLAMAAPPLIIIFAESLVSRAHANWAASAYPAVIAFLAIRYGPRGNRLWAIAAVHAALYAFFLTLALSPQLANAAGVGNGLKRMRGWEETGAAVLAEVRAPERAGGEPYTAVLVDHRHLFFELSYAWRDEKNLPPLRMWLLKPNPGNHAEASAPMTAAADGNVLAVHQSLHYLDRFAGDFRAFDTYKRIAIPLGARKERVLAFSRASGFEPAPRDKAFLETVGE